MRAMRMLAAILLAGVVTVPALAGEDADDAQLLGHVLALVQPIVHAAAASPDPQAAEREIDAILQGRSPEANRKAMQLFDQVLRDMPPGERATFIAMWRDLLTLARREQARRATAPQVAATARAVEARKELHAMGLRYYDAAQYAEAVRRGDAIAVELYRAAGGVKNLPPAH
jgi:hypothetical protein